MGAMKAIAIDSQELQEAALTHDEEGFQEYLEAAGWISPTEAAAYRRRGLLTVPAIDSRRS